MLAQSAGPLTACADAARRPAELVAKFMDNELRSGKDKKSDDQLEATLDKALMLFRYIQVRRPCPAPAARHLLALCISWGSAPGSALGAASHHASMAFVINSFSSGEQKKYAAVIARPWHGLLLGSNILAHGIFTLRCDTLMT